MDRPTVYAGALPRDTDILNLGQFAMIGLGGVAQAALGTGTVVDGFGLTPTAPASLIAVLGPGAIYQQANLEPSPWGSLPADARTIVKQGLNLSAQTLTFSPPVTAGYSQVFLVEVQYQDADTDQKTLPYYNASNPSQPWSGPGNAGSAQNTNRRGVAAVQVKAGIAATAGTQQPPSADAGWAPLFLVTLNAGQTTVTAGNIVAHPNAPFIPVKLPGIPLAVQAGTWTYAVAAGTNTLSASLNPTPPQLVDGLTVALKCPNANTGAATLALNGNAPAPVVRKDGAPLQAGDIAAGEVVRLTYTGGVWGFISTARSEITSTTNSQTINYLLTSGARARFKTQYSIGDVAVDANAPNNYQTYQSGYTDLGTFTVPAGYVCVDLNATYFLLGPTTTGLTTFLGIFGNANDGTGWFLIESNRADKPAGQTITLSRPGLLSLDPTKSYTFSARIAKDVSGGAATAASGNLLGLAFKF